MADRKALSSTSGLVGFQQVHDESAGNTYVDIVRGTIRVPVNDRADFTVAEWLVSSVFRDRANLRREGKVGLMPEFLALVGTGEAPEQLPMKRFAIDKGVRPLVELIVNQVPRAELLAAFDKIEIPFDQFWLEMPYNDGENLRIRMVYWCQKKDGYLHLQPYESSLADESSDGGLRGLSFKDENWVEFHPDRLDICGYDFNEYATLPEESAFKGIDLLDRRAIELLAALVALGSKRIGDFELFRASTPEEDAERAKEFRVNRLKMRSGKAPKISLRPITIEIGPRLKQAMATKKIKEVKQLLGITSVRATQVHLRDGRIVPRVAHERRFPSDVPVDRRGVVRAVTLHPALQSFLDGQRPLTVPASTLKLGENKR